MSRIRDRLGGGPPQRRPAAPTLGQLGWNPGAPQGTRHERAGLGDYLRRGLMIGVVVWLGWWLMGRLVPGSEPMEPATEGGAELPSTTAPAAVERAAAPAPVPAPPPPVEPAAPETVPPPSSVPGAPSEPGPVAPALSAVLTSGERQLAVLDGVVAGVGQSVGPWEVLEGARDAGRVRHVSGVEVTVVF